MSVALPAPSRMDDRVVVITGASSGIGRAAARELALLGAQVAVVGRNPDRTRAVAQETGGRAFLADFDRLDDVRTLAADLLEAYPRTHVLANNAGGTAPKRADTVDGNGQTFQRNHLAAYLLTNLLLDRLRETAADAPEGSVRIVQTSSAANLFGRVDITDLDSRRGRWLNGFPAYGAVKLDNLLFTRQLARQLVGTGVSAYAFHPGFVATGFGGDGIGISLMKRTALSPEEGAAPLVRLASTPNVPAPSGNYFDRLKAPGRTNRQADDRALALGLWAESARRTSAG